MGKLTSVRLEGWKVCCCRNLYRLRDTSLTAYLHVIILYSDVLYPHYKYILVITIISGVHWTTGGTCCLEIPDPRFPYSLLGSLSFWQACLLEAIIFKVVHTEDTLYVSSNLYLNSRWNNVPPSNYKQKRSNI